MDFKELFSGHWMELKGIVKEKFGKLTDDDLTKIDGKLDQLIGILQTKYGYKKDQAVNEVNTILEKYSAENLKESTGHFMKHK